ncbi:hypothetical protein RM704_21410 [Streptomyces sp. DSM 3412]|uniref:Uncharacterized protein n=1 Tax=Streptomyces gottesmaniae TaxID=3075518 RepID=A0ABU2Z0A1_9ACTN|nr:hypothetical protein [Streptomyces sp. DSM 3412]MDT0569998.1 hypothetical protein [Streptomyces sp. DSM 3412]
MVFSRKLPSQLAERYRDMLISMELPLTAERICPKGAVRFQNSSE